MRLLALACVLLFAIFAVSGPIAETLPAQQNKSLQSWRPSCWPARSLPPGFHCQRALTEFINGLEDQKAYIMSSWAPQLPGHSRIRLPFLLNHNLCDFKMYLQISRFPYQFSSTKAELLHWGGSILGICVTNERYSGGGLIWHEIPPAGALGKNVFIMEFFPKGDPRALNSSELDSDVQNDRRTVDDDRWLVKG